MDSTTTKVRDTMLRIDNVPTIFNYRLNMLKDRHKNMTLDEINYHLETLIQELYELKRSFIFLKNVADKP